MKLENMDGGPASELHCNAGSHMAGHRFMAPVNWNMLGTHMGPQDVGPQDPDELGGWGRGEDETLSWVPAFLHLSQAQVLS